MAVRVGLGGRIVIQVKGAKESFFVVDLEYSIPLEHG
jgi:hypothetical protein